MKPIIICDECGSDYVEVYNTFAPSEPDKLKISEYVQHEQGPRTMMYTITYKTLHCRSCDFKLKVSY